MLTPSVHLGADVSKLTIDLGCSQFAVAASIPNTPAGYRTLIKTLLRRPAPVHVVCEATGPYHRAFVAALHQAGILVSVVNPRLPRDFARARGQLAKTDKIDALMLADYGRTMRPAPTPKPEAQMTLLDDLVTRRAQLVEDRTREKMRLQQTTRAETVASLKLHLRHLDGQIKKLLARIAEVVESTPPCAPKSPGSSRSRASPPSPPRPCSPPCPNSAPSQKTKSPPWPALPRSTATAVPSAAPAPSAAVASKYDTPSTWPP